MSHTSLGAVHVPPTPPTHTSPRSPAAPRTAKNTHNNLGGMVRSGRRNTTGSGVRRSGDHSRSETYSYQAPFRSKIFFTTPKLLTRTHIYIYIYFPLNFSRRIETRDRKLFTFIFYFLSFCVKHSSSHTFCFILR